MKLAIIGGGISGLSAAWLLNQRHDVTLYEAEDRLGGHSHTVDAVLPDGTFAVDTGFLVYNEKTYPNLTALFAHLDVPSQVSNMSFGVSVDDGRFEYAGSETVSALIAQKSNLVRPQFQRMLFDIFRFNKSARRYLQSGRDQDEATIEEFLRRGRFGEGFTHHYFLPMCAAIWSSSVDDMRAFPARSLLAFFENHGLLNIYERPLWRTVSGGSRVYVEKLSASFADRTRIACCARRIRRKAEGVLVTDVKGDVENFDAAVLACHADQAHRLIETPTPAETAILGGFRYQANRAVLHADARLMPIRRSVWSSWNYLSRSADDGKAAVSVTYWLNRLQGIESRDPILVSLNPPFEPEPSKVIKRISYDHPLFDHAALAAQARLPEIQGQDRLWFAGAHWGYGFHEDGLLSGLHVAAELGVTPPWWSNVTAFRRTNVAPAIVAPSVTAPGADKPPHPATMGAVD